MDGLGTVGYEVDFLPVGDGEKSGDAIAMRWGDLQSGDPQRQSVAVVDGGTKDSGERLVAHIREFYGTEDVDVVVLTHPDGDHASGLTVVLHELRVGQVWMHQPWNHRREIMQVVTDGRVTQQSIEKRWRENLRFAHELEMLAVSKGIGIYEPFAGTRGFADTGGTLTVLGPSLEYYQELLATFECTPPTLLDGLLIATRKSISEGVRWVRETMTAETLVDPGLNDVRPENNSSTILLLQVDDKSVMLTGDAGVPALANACGHAISLSIDPCRLALFQVPHHGSKHNIGPAMLDFLFGKPENPHLKCPAALVSAAKQSDPRHPSRKVVNALLRRGVGVHTTQGGTTCLRHCVPQRPGWVGASSLGFFDTVEDYSGS